MVYSEVSPMIVSMIAGFEVPLVVRSSPLNVRLKIKIFIPSGSGILFNYLATRNTGTVPTVPEVGSSENKKFRDPSGSGIPGTVQLPELHYAEELRDLHDAEGQPEFHDAEEQPEFHDAEEKPELHDA
jgi:hypothetical protein